MTIQCKLELLRAGKGIITNDRELDAMIALDGPLFDNVRSAPNPKRIGVWDQYVAWIGESTTPPEVKR